MGESEQSLPPRTADAVVTEAAKESTESSVWADCDRAQGVTGALLPILRGLAVAEATGSRLSAPSLAP